MEVIDIVKIVGASFGYILSAIALITMIYKRITGRMGGFIKKETKYDETTHRLSELEKSIKKNQDKDEEFKNEIRASLREIGTSLKLCKEANVELLGSQIEDLYYRRKEVRTLSANEAKKLEHIWNMYHNRMSGNSYAQSMYNEMMNEWNKE